MKSKLKNDGWQMNPDDGFVGHVGGLWQREIGGHLQFAFIALDIHLNSNGVVQGGMLMTFVDRAMGQTARVATGAVRGATISLNHQFLAPVRIGDLVEITPLITKKTSRMVFLTGTPSVEGEPVISAQGVWRVFHSTEHESLIK